MRVTGGGNYAASGDTGMLRLQAEKLYDDKKQKERPQPSRIEEILQPLPEPYGTQRDEIISPDGRTKDAVPDVFKDGAGTPSRVFQRD